MPVYDVSYRPWEGKALRTRTAWLAIAGTMYRRLLRGRLLRTLLFTMTGGAILLSAGLFYMVYQPAGQEMLRRIGPDANVLAHGYRAFLDTALGFATLVAALAGAPLIAEDLRARALPLYFSRPLTHFDYVLGKLSTVALFLGQLLLVPLAGMYLVEVLFAPDEDVARRQVPTLLRACVPALVAVSVFSFLSLASSSLVRRPVGAGLLFLGAIVFSSAIAAVLVQTFDDPNWAAFAPGRAIERITSEFLEGTDPPMRGRPLRATMDASWAWVSAGGWSALGAAVIGWKVRRVEVVT